MNRLAIAALFFASSTSVARADAVSPPTVTCPAGVRAQPAHSPPTGLCIPATCASDADCGMGETCAEAPLCIVQMPVLQRDAGLVPDGGRPAPATFDTAPSACGEGTCGLGDCETRRVCLPPASSSGCAIGGRGVVGAWLLSAAVAIWLARRSGLQRERVLRA